ncbi:hypothetical protein GKC30_08215 [Pseudodesulfovibrio sp. F-1]|uniref:Uncharacterized protein n=1 Tax=Pseudodesulfovibrio alkaliphilus TaxID=2661613 RepID=A0A7K1KNF5_9BACT|nr:hypothetical protein [Pseudodesulfovibrio alkaliphilus]MUM77614.1 hypothetical protein [Pseudodesulfovibrio alkaliphilus]
MGSPAARLNTPEHLRSLVDCGLEFLYAPGRAAPVAAEPVSGAARGGAPLRRPTPPTADNQWAAARPGQGGQPLSTASRQQPPRPAAPSGQSPSATVNPGLPEPWATYFSKAAPSPRIIWTYLELGLDLSGHADTRRSAVLRNLITHLRWPRGTTAFWPVAACHDGALKPDGAMFWRGWEHWRTQHIVCFGHDALGVIHPDAEQGCDKVFREHVTIHVLPPLAELMNRLPHEQQMAVDVLAALRLGAD